MLDFSPRFVQIHYLTSYPSALLNRDDAGFAKRIPFGGATRTRISSQCLKRHWRKFDGEHSLRSLEIGMSVRSRRTFDRYIYRALLDDQLPEELVKIATEEVMKQVLGESPKRKEKKKGEEEQGAAKQSEDHSKGISFETGQVTVLGHKELDYIRSEIKKAILESNNEAKHLREILKDRFKKGEGKKNLEALRNGAGLDAALFGRMVTGDILARIDAPVHVAHAFTVHAESTEPDYFTVVDDLMGETELGAAHINTTELSSGLYYGYIAIDVPLLISNLEGCKPNDIWQADKELAAKVVRSLIYTVATVSPGAKLGSTAPHSYANLVMIETGNAQPRTMANAFLKPVSMRGDLLTNAYDMLAKHWKALKGMYPDLATNAKLAGIGQLDELLRALDNGQQKSLSLNELADWAAASIKGV